MNNYQTITIRFSDKFFENISIQTCGDKFFLGIRIYDFIAKNSLFFKKIFQLSPSLFRHFFFHFKVLTRFTVFIVFITRGDKIAIFRSHRYIGRYPIIGQHISSKVFPGIFEEFSTIHWRSLEWTNCSLRLSKLLIGEEYHCGLIFLSEIERLSTPIIGIFESRR